jgi:hypothetical protein
VDGKPVNWPLTAQATHFVHKVEITMWSVRQIGYGKTSGTKAAPRRRFQRPETDVDPDNILQSMPVRPYAEIRDEIRSGDLLLCQGRDLFSRLIQWATKSPWSHIAIAFEVQSVNRIVVVEAVEKIGVRCVPLSRFVSSDSAGHSPHPGRILLCRSDTIDGKADNVRAVALADFAFDHLGDRFAPGQIIRIGLRILAARIMGDRKTPKFLLPNDEFICSEFIAKAFETAGLPIPWDGLGFIAPADFALDPALSAVAQVDVSRPPRT